MVEPVAQERSRRVELVRFIASSRKVQRRLRWIVLAGIALALGLRFGGAGSTAFLIALVTTGIIGGVGVWITQGHINDFEQQIHELDRRRP